MIYAVIIEVEAIVYELHSTLLPILQSIELCSICLLEVTLLQSIMCNWSICSQNGNFITRVSSYYKKLIGNFKCNICITKWII